MPLQRTSGIPLVSVAVALASGAPEKSRAEVYAGVCACNYDSEADSCHAEQTVSGDSIEELSRVCSNQLGEHARMVAGSVRGEPQQNLRDVGYPGDAPDSGS